jgi:hypothetical protein
MLRCIVLVGGLDPATLGGLRDFEGLPAPLPTGVRFDSSPPPAAAAALDFAQGAAARTGDTSDTEVSQDSEMKDESEDTQPPGSPSPSS